MLDLAYAAQEKSTGDVTLNDEHLENSIELVYRLTVSQSTAGGKNDKLKDLGKEVHARLESFQANVVLISAHW